MLQAKYVGTNKSMGFHTGEIYHLRTEVKTVPKVKNPCICVYDVNGSAWCPYASLEAVLSNWKIYRVQEVEYGESKH